MADYPQPIAPVGAPSISAFTPLREPLFRNLWVAAVISYTGSWMQNLGTGWLMASLTESPLLIGMVQAAMSLPVFLVALPAGALADMVDRRRLLLVTQLWMVVSAALLGVLTIFDLVSPWTVLIFTFLLGIGAVMNDPAWQAITPEIVSQREFTAAVALNSAGFNVARAIGPLIGGVVIAFAGSGPAFLVNAASFFGVIYFLYRWKNRPHPTPLPLRRLRKSVREGVEYIGKSSPVKSVLVRTGLFSVFASVLWALLPLIARPFGAMGYGFLLGAFGLGAFAGAGLLPRLRMRLPVNAVFALATFLFAGSTILVTRIDTLVPLCSVFFVAGACWIKILASLNVCAQTMAPASLRARALSAYLLVLQGGMAVGSAIWGVVAEAQSIDRAFLFAAAGLLLGLLTISRYKLETSDLELRSAEVG
jgi:MFS family permease